MRSTRFRYLGYDKVAPNIWRIFDLCDGRESAVGPIYKTRAELLADLERFARAFGY